MARMEEYERAVEAALQRGAINQEEFDQVCAGGVFRWWVVKGDRGKAAAGQARSKAPL